MKHDFNAWKKETLPAGMQIVQQIHICNEE